MGSCQLKFMDPAMGSLNSSCSIHFLPTCSRFLEEQTIDHPHSIAESRPSPSVHSCEVHLYTLVQLICLAILYGLKEIKEPWFDGLGDGSQKHLGGRDDK